MQKAIDVANFFIELANNSIDDCMTNLRVNKLLYFAQAYSMVRFGKMLFNEEIQAWQYGPVVPSVYQTFKSCGGNRLNLTSSNYSSEIFTTDEITLLLDVARYYGQYTSPKLIDITHEKGSPWEVVYDENKMGVVISIESMKEYFSHKELLTFEPKYDPERDVVGVRNGDGYLVLPKEYNEAE